MARPRIQSDSAIQPVASHFYTLRSREVAGVGSICASNPRRRLRSEEDIEPPKIQDRDLKKKQVKGSLLVSAAAQQHSPGTDLYRNQAAMVGLVEKGLWLRGNTRTKVQALNVPVEKVVDVGFVKEV